MALVKKLRDITQAKLNDCRKAVLESGGDLKEAMEYLQKKGQATVSKVQGKVASEGVVKATVLEATGQVGAIVEVNIQTDFAARNPDFLAFTDKVLQEVLVNNIACATSGEPGLPGVAEERSALVAKLGENIVIRRFHRIETLDGYLTAYNHGTGIAVLVSSPKPHDVMLDVAMQIAAMNPTYKSLATVPETDLEKQKDIFRAQLKEDGKVPEDKWDRVLTGKIQKWAKDVCLLEQESVVESKKTIAQVLEAAGLDPVKVDFIRFERGDGVDVEKGDFAAEVAAMASN